MTLEQQILEAVQALPEDDQYEILMHAARLRKPMGEKKPFKVH